MNTSKLIIAILVIITSSGIQIHAATEPPISSADKKFEEQNSTNKTTDWAHMKNYRVWEAKKKEFIYPENYIEPETSASGSANSNHKLNKKGN